MGTRCVHQLTGNRFLVHPVIKDDLTHCGGRVDANLAESEAGFGRQAQQVSTHKQDWVRVIKYL